MAIYLIKRHQRSANAYTTFWCIHCTQHIQSCSIWRVLNVGYCCDKCALRWTKSSDYHLEVDDGDYLYTYYDLETAMRHRPALAPKLTKI